MAIFHLSVSTISRAKNRSATAAAAYRAGVRIEDQRTGEVHDYTRKRGVVYADVVLPADAPEWAADRAVLWNAAELAETRKNSTVAREFEIALPEELSPTERQRLARDLAREIVERHGCAADVAIHAPSRNGDDRNYHAHILLSTRRIGADGFGEKTRELDDKKTGSQIITQWRERFAALQNERLREAGSEARVDHRSLEAQGIEREPTRHLGPAATGYERRTGLPSRRRIDLLEEAIQRLEAARADGERERQEQAQGILVLDGNVQAARRAARETAQNRAGGTISGGGGRVVPPHNPQLEQERRRRIEALPRVVRLRGGAAHVLARLGLEACEQAGGADRVDWIRMEARAILESIFEHHQEPDDVLAAILEYSPAAADPRRHELVRRHIEEASAMALEQEQEQERRRVELDDGLELE